MPGVLPLSGRIAALPEGPPGRRVLASPATSPQALVLPLGGSGLVATSTSEEVRLGRGSPSVALPRRSLGLAGNPF
jgi:hypothetical protein